MDAEQFKAALGRWATGVTVITTRARSGAAAGLTASSFSSLSLDPPLVLFCRGDGSAGREAFENAEGFAVHILSQEQRDAALRFAKPAGDKFEGLSTREGLRGIPLLPGSLVCLECRTAQVFRAGDHQIFVGQVEQIHMGVGEPLIYHLGQYRNL
jgi:flavin reductase (DIM6/NTAB) family NADH-FMN oxidoreductase RutF